jgi:hypothetical protein
MPEMKRAVSACIFLLVLGSLTTSAQPSLAWARSLGDNGEWDRGNAIVTDDSGNVYTAGMFVNSADFDPGPGSFTLTSAGSGDIYISKLDRNGAFVWAQQIGGIGWDRALGITIDRSSNIYLTGDFSYTVDFDPGPGTCSFTQNGIYTDIFVLKLNASGGFQWARQIASDKYECGTALATDSKCNVLVTGMFLDTVDFDPGPGNYDLISNGDYDAFLLKLDSSGNFMWAKNIGGSGEDFGLSVAVDGNGSGYATGYFHNTADLDPGPGSFLLSAGGPDRATYAVKLNSQGNFMWAAGAEGSMGNGICVTSGKEVYITGCFSGAPDFDPGTGVYNLSASFTSPYIWKLDSMGSFIWARALQSNFMAAGATVGTGSHGECIIGGYFMDSLDCDPGGGSCMVVNGGGPNNNENDVFLCMLDSSGAFTCAGSMGGGSNDMCYALAVDDSGTVYATGFFSGTADFDPSPQVNSLISTGTFVTKYEPCMMMSSIMPGPSDEHEFVIFSDPSCGSVTVSGLHYPFQLTLFDALGKAIFTRSVFNQVTIDLPAVPGALYFVRLQNSRHQCVKKLLIR